MNRIASAKFTIYQKNELVDEVLSSVSFKAIYDDGESQVEKAYDLRLSDVVNMLDGLGVHEVGYREDKFSPEDFTLPSGHSDFGWIVSVLLTNSYKFGLLDKVAYETYVNKHFDLYYLRVYKSKRKMAQDFFDRYFPKNLREKYGNDYTLMLDKNSELIEEKGKKVMVEVSKKSEVAKPIYDLIIPVAERLRVCFMYQDRL